MNAWQIALEIRTILRALNWPSGSQEPVFGDNVFIVAAMPGENDLPAGFPWALVFVGSGRTDDNEPHLEIDRSFTVGIGQLVEGDPLGESVVIGGARVDADIGTSAGRGILELAAVVKEEIGRLSKVSGVGVIWGLVDAPDISPIGPGMHLATMALRFTVMATTEAEWARPYNVTVTGTTASWEPSHQAAGFVEYVVVRKYGSTPPSSPSDGEEVGRTTGTSLTNGALISGYTVAVFAGYSLTGGGGCDVYSDTDEPDTWYTMGD